MNRKIIRIVAATGFSAFSLCFLTACFCWPTLPDLIHRGSCGGIQYASQTGRQYAPPPPENYIAYIHEGDVWIMDPDGKNKTQLTKTPEREFSLSAAYQAERIWFVRETAISTNGNAGDVYSFDYDGKNISRVTDGIPITFVAVSVDGKNMGVSVISTIGQTAAPSPDQTNDMWLMSAVKKRQGAGGDHIDLTGDLPASGAGGRLGSTFLAWSPQVDQVAFTFKADGSSSLGISTKSVYTAKADGTDRRKLVDSCDEPSFNNQGTKLAVTTGAHWDTMGVLAVDVETGKTENVLTITDGNPLYSAATPLWLTTYENIEENDNVIYSKTTHPAAPAEPVNTLEIYGMTSGKTSVLTSEEGSNQMILNAWPMVLERGVVFQKGIDPATSSIWSLASENDALTKQTRLSDSETAGDSEPTSAVSYSWYNKDGAAGGGMQFQTCHWPYAENRNWPYQK